MLVCSIPIRQKLNQSYYVYTAFLCFIWQLTHAHKYQFLPLSTQLVLPSGNRHLRTAMAHTSLLFSTRIHLFCLYPQLDIQIQNRHAIHTVTSVALPWIFGLTFLWDYTPRFLVLDSWVRLLPLCGLNWVTAPITVPYHHTGRGVQFFKHLRLTVYFCSILWWLMGFIFTKCSFYSFLLNFYRDWAGLHCSASPTYPDKLDTWTGLLLWGVAACHSSSSQDQTLPRQTCFQALTSCTILGLWLGDL